MLLRPQTGYYADLVEQAAALWESLAMNHGFVDGNAKSPSPASTSSSASTARGWRRSRTQVIAFIYRHLEAGTFRKPAPEEWLREHVTAA